MDNGRVAKKATGPDLSLTPDQQNLLLTALTSNRSPVMQNQNANTSARGSNTAKPAAGRANSDPKQGRHSMDVNSSMGELYKSPVQESPGSGAIGSDGFDDSPFLDYEVEDGSFDWENSGEQLFGSLPGAPLEEDGDLHEKRKLIEDEDEEGENGSKRWESEDKLAKKPGRKPLTGEPTTKRKAQNRAAQRAFRERKERHLKELETKVEDLEKASESTNHENGKLRAQVDRLTNEVKEYKKRLSMNGTGAVQSPPSAAALLSRRPWNPNQNDFQFAFPKFGDLPGSNFMSNGSLARVSSSNRSEQRPSSQLLPGALRTNSSSSFEGASPTNVNGPTKIGSTDYGPFPSPTNLFSAYQDPNGLFGPSILEAARRSNSSDMNFDNNRAASNVENQGNHNRGSSISITTSPSASSMSNHGLDSSCGTTPEPSADSPDIRKASETTLNTIDEEILGQKNLEAPSSAMKHSFNDINGIDWMAQQNGGQFDPVLFGDYRDPQDNILNNASFGGFFNDAFAQDFASPFNTGEFTTSSPTLKRDLMKEIETQANGYEDDAFHFAKVSQDETKRPINCEKLWDRMQGSEKVQSGEIDINDLCAQLKAKAKCNGSEAVIDEKDMNDILGPPSATVGEMDLFKIYR